MSSAKPTNRLGRESKKESNSDLHRGARESKSDLHRGVEGAVKGFERRLPIEQRFGVTVSLASEFIGISKSRIYELLATGEVEGVIVGGRRIVLVPSLLRLLGQAPSAKREKGTARSEQSTSP